MAAKKFLSLVSNFITEIAAVVVSAGAGNDGDLVALDATGKLDLSVLPSGIGPEQVTAVASEAIGAGDYVHLYDNAGTLTMRLADATTASAGDMAHGFVLDNVSSSASGTVYIGNQANTALSGLTQGVQYVLDPAVPGGVIARASASYSSGDILQVLGIAISATELESDIDDNPIIRA